MPQPIQVRLAGSDIGYHPVLGDLDDLIQAQEIAHLLLVGSAVPRSLDHGSTHVRIAAVLEPPLPSGIYWFNTDDGVALLAVDGPQPPGSPATESWDAADGDPLINAYGWWSSWWDNADKVPAPSFDVSDELVTVPDGQEAKVRSRRFIRGSWMYEVRVEGRTVQRAEDKLARPQIDDNPEEWIRRAPGDAGRFAATLTRAKLASELTDTVFSFRATRTIFRPYQFRPVMRLLETGQLRLLIADEVGLGKTIEAGLVWTELDARRLANRVLIVCPSMLLPKWRREMDERFSFDLQELDRAGLDDMLDRIESDRLPGRFHAVCSIERMRMWAGLERLAELAPRFDLVIADEAHIFRNAGTRSNALGVLLSDWADALVFLSATPLNLGNDDLFNLLELLAPGEFDDRLVLEDRLAPNAVLHRVAASLLDRQVTNSARVAWLAEIGQLTFGRATFNRPEFHELIRTLSHDDLSHAQIAQAKRLIASLHALSAVVTRTRKVEVEDRKAVREARRIDVEWTDEEAEFYVVFERWQRERALKRGMPVGFVTQMPLRLASTCLPAARDQVLNGSLGQDEDLDAEAREPGDSDIEDDTRPPRDVVDAARAIPDGCDSKFDAFVRHLRTIVDQERQVLVFTFSRVALAYLENRLRSHVSLTVLHGGVKKPQREDVMRRFREGEFQVMLASRVASEGLDFEFCSAVVNYDLPWNPMEVEQRIGRIDRIGQTEEKVLVLNFFTPGTIETDIVERVHERIGVFTDSIGELEPILQSTMSDLKKAMFDFSLTAEQRERRIDETLTAIEERRRTLDEVEDATAFLSSTDQAEIDGLEDDLLANGRYVGQPELVHLVRDWAERDPDARCSVSADHLRLTVRGTAALAAELMAVQAAGERSLAELDAVSQRLRDEQSLILSLDQEHARTTGLTLLASTHPLVRAALRVPGHQQLRFADLTVVGADAPPGGHLVLFSLARWTGARPSTELWTSAIELGAHRPSAGSVVGAAVLAALAEGQILPSERGHILHDLEQPLRMAIDYMLERQLSEEQRRTEANDALIEARRISLEETHRRKQGQIRRRIATAREKGNTRVVGMFEGQLRTQARLLDEEIARLDTRRHGAMEVEHLAVATVTVRS